MTAAGLTAGCERLVPSATDNVVGQVSFEKCFPYHSQSWYAMPSLLSGDDVFLVLFEHTVDYLQGVGQWEFHNPRYQRSTASICHDGIPNHPEPVVFNSGSQWKSIIFHHLPKETKRCCCSCHCYCFLVLLKFGLKIRIIVVISFRSRATPLTTSSTTVASKLIFHVCHTDARAAHIFIHGLIWWMQMRTLASAP